MPKKSRFRGCFEKQYGKRAQALLKYLSQTLYHIHQPLPSKLSSKKSLLLTCKILELLVNTLAADKNVSSSSVGQFNDTNSDAIISEKKSFF